MSALSHDWYGKQGNILPRYAIFKTSSLLQFVATVNTAPFLHPAAQACSFVEGLWEYDVAELFLMFQNGHYLELNLAANGACWAQWFSSYRERSEELVVDPSLFQSEGSVHSNHWQATLSLPLQILPELPSKAHVSFIVLKPNLQYFSSCAQDFEPDFHRASCFTALAFQ